MKLAKYLMGFILAIVVLYNSVYFMKLDEVKASSQSKDFDAARYAREFWNNKLMANLNKAVELTALFDQLSLDEDGAFDTHSHALGIGNLRYFLVSSRGTVKSVDDDAITVALDGGKAKTHVTIATEFIFGNAVRDATGLINIDEFENTMDFNNVSAEINSIIRKDVLPALKKDVVEGDILEFTGAIELNRENFDLLSVEVVPVRAVRIQSAKTSS
jgi:predicted lipoprotein